MPRITEAFDVRHRGQHVWFWVPARDGLDPVYEAVREMGLRVLDVSRPGQGPLFKVKATQAAQVPDRGQEATAAPDHQASSTPGPETFPRGSTETDGAPGAGPTRDRGTTTEDESCR